MRVAHHLAQSVLPCYSSKFSRKDFTLPQVFACLVVREHQKKSYRGLEALLRDAPHWCWDIGMKRVPDHNTLCRAFGVIVTRGNADRMLDVLARWFGLARALGFSTKPLVMDTSYFESHHVSRHYERRCAQTRRRARRRGHGRPEAPAKTGTKARSRSRAPTVKRLPKLGTAVAAACHLILAVRARAGAGGDALWFEPLLGGAKRRARGIRKVAADPGFDSEHNHCLARQQLGVRSIIPPHVGRPTHKPCTGRYRRLMQRRFARRADAKDYGQRWQSETVNSMIKRNLGSALRAKTARRRSGELLLRCLTHNIALLRRRLRRVETEQDAASFHR